MATFLRRGSMLILVGLVLRPPLALAQSGVVAFKPPEDVEFRTRDIISEGTRMAAEVFSPKGQAGKTLPTIILCHGWGSVAQDLRPEAIAFARAGYLAVTFDYRGWGTSDARLVLASPAPSGHSGKPFTAEVKEVREVVDPLDQTTDLMNAIHWVVGEPQCDPSRIGLWGSSYSGGHVATSPRVIVGSRRSSVRSRRLIPDGYSWVRGVEIRPTERRPDAPGANPAIPFRASAWSRVSRGPRSASG